MELNGIRIGFVLTGSFYSMNIVIPEIKKLIKENAKVIPIMSFNSFKFYKKFGRKSDIINKIEEITGKKIINNLIEVEPIGRKNKTDIMIIAPCTR